jgi:hypothetical protein
MAVDYIKRTETLTIECEYCGNPEEYNGSFPECIEQSKDEGWLIFKDGFQYVHFCGSLCYNEYHNQEKG